MPVLITSYRLEEVMLLSGSQCPYLQNKGVGLDNPLLTMVSQVSIVINTMEVIISISFQKTFYRIIYTLSLGKEEENINMV